MPANATGQNLGFDISSVDDVAGLRQNNGITVHVPALSNLPLHLNREPRSNMCCRSRMTSSSVARKQNYRSFSSGRLGKENSPLNCKGATSCHSFWLCHSKIQGLESLISSMTQQTLSSVSYLRRSLSPLPGCRWIFYFFIIVVLLLSHLASSDALFSSTSKAPLTKTDATNVLHGFRQFTGQGPIENYRKGRRRKSGQHNSRSANIPDKPLDFQTMKMIKRWGPTTSDVLLVSGKDYIYMINAADTSTEGKIRYLERLKWASSLDSQNACQQMGKQKHECNNFIRVVELQQDNRLYVCGTNSYAPKCRFYTRDNFSPTASSSNSHGEDVVCHRQCECPFNPATSSANLYTNTSVGFQLFSAVINDFMGKKPVLMRKGSSYVYSVERWFNDPTFIKMVESDDGKVYLFFRETATAVETGNPSPTIYARVAQVCKDDLGGETVLRHQWTSFLKARLKCSISGSSRGPEFDFDNLTSVSDVTRILGPDGQPMDVIFATFTTPWEWDSLSMSAVCVYYMDTIKQLFELGSFLGEQELHSGPIASETGFNSGVETLVKAIPVPSGDVPDPRPGKCSGTTSSTNDQTLSFAKDHSLMYDPVMPLYQQPMYVGESDVRMTQITVDSNAGGNGQHLVLYVGTEDGRILRIRPRLQISSGPKSILLEEMRIADKHNCTSGRLSCGVLALQISSPPFAYQGHGNSNSSLFVAFTNRLVQVPLTRCQQYRKAKCCNIDPNCGWLANTCEIRTAYNQQELSETSDMTDIPINCQATSSPDFSGKPGRSTTTTSNQTTIQNHRLHSFASTYTESVFLAVGGNENIGAAGGDLYLLVAFLSFVFGILCTLAAAYLVYRYRQRHPVLKLTNIATVHYKKSLEQLNDLGASLKRASQSTLYSVIDKKNNEVEISTTERPMSLIHEIKVERARSEYTILHPSSDDNENIAGNEEENDDGEKIFIGSDTSVPLLPHLTKAQSIDDNKLTPLPTKQDEFSVPVTALPEPFSEEQILLNSQETSNEKPKLPPKQQSMKKKQESLDSPQLERPATVNQNNSNLAEIRHSNNADTLSSSLLRPISETSMATNSPKLQPPKKPPPPRFQQDVKKPHSMLHSREYKPPIPIKSSSIIRSSLQKPPPAVNTKHSSSLLFSKENQVPPVILAEK